MSLLALATSRWGPALVIVLCRVLPRPVISRIGGWLASYLARQRDLAFVQALRANIAMVRGLPEEDAETDRAVQHLLHNAFLSYADFFQVVQGGRAHVRVQCELDVDITQEVSGCLAEGRGLLLVGAHMCSFDLLLLSLKERFPSVQVLSNAHPTGSSTVMNELRARHGLEVTPLSIPALRQAVERLRGGGVVAVAADIPAESGEELIFFGHESRLPVGHARLALATGAEILVGVSHRVGSGAYRAEVALVPRPESTGNRKQDVTHWAQQSLSTIESFIRRWPEEWLMPIPIWAG